MNRNQSGYQVNKGQNNRNVNNSYNNAFSALNQSQFQKSTHSNHFSTSQQFANLGQQQIDQSQSYCNESNERQVKSATKLKRVNNFGANQERRSSFKPIDSHSGKNLSNNEGKNLSDEKDLSPTFGFENNELTLNGEIEMFGQSKSNSRAIEIEQEFSQETVQLRRSNSEYTLGNN